MHQSESLMNPNKIIVCINHMCFASCSLGPILNPLLVECIDHLFPTITHIVNESLPSGAVPSSLKAAVIKPVLKKPSLDKNNIKNYRPVSDLYFFGPRWLKIFY